MQAKVTTKIRQEVVQHGQAQAFVEGASSLGTGLASRLTDLHRCSHQLPACLFNAASAAAISA